MKHQKQLKDNKTALTEQLRYFRMYSTLSNNINNFNQNVSSDTFMDSLDRIDECTDYLSQHVSVVLIISY